MINKRYLPVKANRLFTLNTKYSDIDWNDFDTAVDYFNERIDNWYVRPITDLLQNVHYGFPVIGLTCLLIDTLSQFHAGALKGTGNLFKEFVRTNLHSFSGGLINPIKVPQPTGPDTEVKDYADVLYSGFRCGIFHEANVTPYGVIAANQNSAVDLVPIGITKYVDNSNCPSIILDPQKLFDEVKVFYQSYIKNLKDHDRRFDTLRLHFREKFAWSFGIDIGNEP